MAYTLEQFAADIHTALQADRNDAGREAVRKLVERALADPEFLEKYVPADSDQERKVLYEDPEFGFCICAHAYKGEKMGKPHDHGPTWAIYGQAAGETEMTDWRMVTPPSGGKPGTVEKVRSYLLRPGEAHAYAPGDIHAPLRRGPTRLIRIEGKNTDTVERTPLEAV
jgi:hypothetical protein